MFYFNSAKHAQNIDHSGIPSKAGHHATIAYDCVRQFIAMQHQKFPLQKPLYSPVVKSGDQCNHNIYVYECNLLE